MSFKKLLLTILTATLLFAPTFVLADKYGLDTAATQAELPKSVAGASNVIELIGAIVGIVLALVGVVFFILVLYAGGVWMTAMGNSERVTKAKELLETASIGLVIVLAAYAIANFVFKSLELGGGGASATGDEGCAARRGVCGYSCDSAHNTTVPDLCLSKRNDREYVCCVPK